MEKYCSKVCSCGEEVDAALLAGMTAKKELDAMGPVVKTVNGVPPDMSGNVIVSGGGGVSSEEIRSAVEDYMAEHPIEDGFAVQPDFSQNDPTNPDYIKNRTHWEEDNRGVIEWDGNTEGLAVYKYGTETYYRISSNRPPEEDIIGSIVTFSDNRIASHVVTESEVAGFENNRVALISDCLLIIDIPTYPGVVTQNGTYARIKDGPFGTYYPARFTYGSIVVHQLDEKFIPDTIARKGDVTGDSAGLYIGSDEPPDGATVWVDPSGEPSGMAAEISAAINRTTAVNAADTNYTALMARGTSLNREDAVPAVNGAICWTYE